MRGLLIYREMESWRGVGLCRGVGSLGIWDMGSWRSVGSLGIREIGSWRGMESSIRQFCLNLDNFYGVKIHFGRY